MITWQSVEANFGQSKGLTFPFYKVLLYIITPRDCQGRFARDIQLHFRINSKKKPYNC